MSTTDWNEPIICKIGGQPPPVIGAECMVQMDADLKLVMEFMLANVPVEKLNGVAQALPVMAAIVWGQYGLQPVEALALRRPSICDSVRQDGDQIIKAAKAVISETARACQQFPQMPGSSDPKNSTQGGTP